MRTIPVRATLCLAVVAVAVPLGSALATSSANSHPVRSSGPPLFAVGIAGGFTGVSMKATVYADGSVTVVRVGGGEARTALPSVPSCRGST